MMIYDILYDVIKMLDLPEIIFCVVGIGVMRH